MDDRSSHAVQLERPEADNDGTARPPGAEVSTDPSTAPPRGAEMPLDPTPRPSEADPPVDSGTAPPPGADASVDSDTERRSEADPPVDTGTEDSEEEVAAGKSRRQLLFLIVPLVLAAIGVGGWFLLHTRLFSARSVTVQGAVHESEAQVLGAAKLQDDPPLMDIDPGRIAASVERLPWVSTAQVSLRWPDGVLITVIERKPVAVIGYALRDTAGARSAPRWAEVDRTGRVLGDVGTPPPRLPGISAGVVPGVPGSHVQRRVQPGLTVVTSLPAAFRQQVTGVRVTGGQEVTLTLTTPITVRIGSANQLPAKYEDVAAMLAHASLAAGDVIDVSAPDSPVVVGG